MGSTSAPGTARGGSRSVRLRRGWSPTWFSAVEPWCRLSSTPRASARRALLDGEVALHAALGMAGDRADVRVLARLQVGLEARRAPVADDVPFAVSLERDVVIDRRRVVHHELDAARRCGGRAGRKGKRARLVRVDLENAVLGSRLSALLDSDVGELARVL